MMFDPAFVATIVAEHGASFIIAPKHEIHEILIFAGMNPDIRVAPIYGGRRYGREIERIRRAAPAELVAFADANRPMTNEDADEYARVLRDTFGESIELVSDW